MFSEVPLTVDMMFVLALLGLTIILMLSDVIRVDVVALLVLVSIGISRLLPPEQLFSGFSSEAVISLIAITIISAGLEKSGIAIRMARWVLKLGRHRITSISFVLMLVSGLSSAFMRSLGSVALFLPVVSKITMRTGIPKSRFLMPIAFCSIMGGTLTMVGSSGLILLNSLLKNSDRLADQTTVPLEPFSLFSVFPIGAVLLFCGIVYFLLFGKKLLPKEHSQPFSSSTTKQHFFKAYGKGGDIFEFVVTDKSDLIGLSVQEVEVRLDPSSSILAVICGKSVHFPPLRRIQIEKDAHIAIMGDKDILVKFAEIHGLERLGRLDVFSEMLHPSRSGLCEAVIPPSSQLIGLELRELHMKRTHQVHVLAVRRGKTVLRGEELRDIVLRSGDTLGMYSQWEILTDFHKNPDFVVVTSSYPRDKIRPGKVKYALGFFLLSLLLIVIGKFSLSVGLLLGASGMIATGVLSVDEAYDSVSWKSVFLMAGLIPLGLVMDATHTTDWLTQHTLGLKGDLPNWIMQASLALLTTLMSVVISNVGATIILVPIAVEMATNVGADPRLYALIVAIASSNAFLMPTQQANALISGPGGYHIKDFVKAGSGMTILFLVVMIVMVNLCFG